MSKQNMRKVLIPKWSGTVKKSQIIAAIKHVKAHPVTRAASKKEITKKTVHKHLAD